MDTNIVVIAMSPDERSVDGYRATDVDSVLRVMAAIQHICIVPPRVLFVSSTAIYGVDDGSWTEVLTPAELTVPTAVVLRQAEEALLEEIPEAIILRLGGIYGPGRTREVDRVPGGIGTIWSEPRFTNLIHRDDAAAAIVHLMTMPDWPETVYIGIDDCPVDYREVVEFLARSLGVSLSSVAVDSASPEVSQGKRCYNTRLRECGFAFSYPTYREGYAAVLEGIEVRHP